MFNKNYLSAMAGIDEDLIARAERKNEVNPMSYKPNIKKMWLPIAAALVVVFVAVLIVQNKSNILVNTIPSSELTSTVINTTNEESEQTTTTKLNEEVHGSTISTEKITQSDTTKPIQQTTITTSAAHSSTEESTKIDTTKPVQNTTVTNPAVHTSKEENTKSNTTQPVPNTTNPMIPEEQASSLEEWRIKEVKYAMTALPKVDAEKINIDKSYNDAMISDSPIDGYRWNAQNLPGWEFGAGEEAYVMHLDAKDFYYEVVISAGFNKIYAVKKFNK